MYRGIHVYFSLSWVCVWNMRKIRMLQKTDSDFHTVYARRNNARRIWGGRPRCTSHLGEYAATNCATTNHATFENGQPFESVFVCSDSIHHVAAEVLLQKIVQTIVKLARVAEMAKIRTLACLCLFFTAPNKCGNHVRAKVLRVVIQGQMRLRLDLET